MEVFQELKLKPASMKDIDVLFDRIREKSSKVDWVVRNDFVENYKNNMAERDKKIICLMSPKIHVSKNHDIQGYVWLGQWKELLEVFNIVPVKSGSLSYSEYNEILKQFFNELIFPELSNLNFQLTYTSPRKSIDEIAGKEVSKALISFSRLANKSTGNSHPMDSERWKRFVCLAHKLKSALNAEELVRWLKEEDDWSDEKAWELGIDFEYSLDLLSYYESNFSS
jgi:hypothetical protein